MSLLTANKLKLPK